MVPSIVVVPTIARSTAGCLHATKTVSVWNGRGILRRNNHSKAVYFLLTIRLLLPMPKRRVPLFLAPGLLKPGAETVSVSSSSARTENRPQSRGRSEFHLGKPCIYRPERVLSITARSLSGSKEKKKDRVIRKICRDTVIKFICEKSARKNGGWVENWVGHLDLKRDLKNQG